MYYLVYILAAFGVIFILIVVIRLVMWCLKCDIETQFVPVGGSDAVSISLRSNSIVNDNDEHTDEFSAIQTIDKMLEQLTKPKTIVSRQCICPFCTREIDKLTVTVKTAHVEDRNSLVSSDISLIASKETHEIGVNTVNDQTIENNSMIKSNAVEDNGEEAYDMSEEQDKPVLIIANTDCEQHQCKLYNNVVLELKSKFDE